MGEWEFWSRTIMMSSVGMKQKKFFVSIANLYTRRFFSRFLLLLKSGGTLNDRWRRLYFSLPETPERHEVKINGMCNFLIPRTIRIPFWTFNGRLPINSVEYLLWDIFTSPPTVFCPFFGSRIKWEGPFSECVHKYTIEQKAFSIFRHRKKERRRKMFLIMSE